MLNSTQPLPPRDCGLADVNLYLVGLMGAGKTTTGQYLATQLGYRFVDTDTLVAKIAGRPIPAIFAELGEAQFRDWETQVLAEVSAYPRLVIATGGGIILNPLNWSYLHHGIVAWLNVPLPQLAQRLSQDQNRPLLQPEDPCGDLTAQRLAKLETLWLERGHLYAQADIEVKVEGDTTSAQVGEQVLALIPTVLKTAVPASHAAELE